MSGLLVTVSLLMLLSGSMVNGNFECPSFCTCGSTATTIDCDGTGISTSDIEALFLSLPNDVVVFGLSKSTLSNLETKLFSRILPNLKTLKLASNKLKEVPQNLSGVFPSLEDLNLNSNEIEEVGADDLAGLTKLLKLRLDQNKLTKIGANTFKSSNKLQSVFLLSNQISQISQEAFNGLESLSYLVLTDNNLKTLPEGIFTSFKNSFLQIHLKQNHLTQIPKGLFRNGQSLLFVDFQSNKISTIDDDAFAGCTINVVNLKNNSIVHLSPNVLSALKNFVSVQIDLNPINCNCNIAKIKLYLKENFSDKPSVVKHGLIGECATPAGMKNVKIVDIPLEGIEEKLKCSICDLNNTCVNNAKCISISKIESKCECLTGYEGLNCEHEIPSTVPSTSGDEKKDSGGTTTYIIIAVVVLIILVIIAIIVFICLRKRRNSQEVVDGEKNDEKLLEGGSEMTEKA